MAAELKRIRAATGLSQPKFAAYVTERGGDLKEGTLAAVETGRRNMSEHAVDRLADALDLHPRERSRLHRARRAQMAMDLEAGTARRLEAVEQRLAELERRMAELDGRGAATRLQAIPGQVVHLDPSVPHAADPDADDELAARTESPSDDG